MTITQAFDQFIDTPTREAFNQVLIAGTADLLNEKLTIEDFASDIIDCKSSEADFLETEPYVEIITTAQEVLNGEDGAESDLLDEIKSLTIA